MNSPGLLHTTNAHAHRDANAMHRQTPCTAYVSRRDAMCTVLLRVWGLTFALHSGASFAPWRLAPERVVRTARSVT